MSGVSPENTAVGLVGFLLEFNVLTTSTVISGWVALCVSVHEGCCIVLSLFGDQAAVTMYDLISHSVTLS